MKLSMIYTTCSYKTYDHHHHHRHLEKEKKEGNSDWNGSEMEKFSGRSHIDSWFMYAGECIWCCIKFTLHFSHRIANQKLCLVYTLRCAQECISIAIFTYTKYVRFADTYINICMRWHHKAKWFPNTFIAESRESGRHQRKCFYEEKSFTLGHIGEHWTFILFHHGEPKKNSSSNEMKCIPMNDRRTCDAISYLPYGEWFQWRTEKINTYTRANERALLSLFGSKYIVRRMRRMEFFLVLFILNATCIICHLLLLLFIVAAVVVGTKFLHTVSCYISL